MSSEHDVMLTETIARHFERAHVSGTEIDLGVAGLHMACKVERIQELGAYRTAHLFFLLWGGQLGEERIFASASGYGHSPEEAIVVGGCNWACTFGPVLRVALAGESHEEPTTFDAVLDDQRFRGVVDGLDRTFSYAEADQAHEAERIARSRERFGGKPHLAPRVIESATLPILPVDRATTLSVFASDAAGLRVLEVKVNGRDWPPSQRLLDSVPPPAEEGGVLLREFAVLVPAGSSPPLKRAAVARTVRGAPEASEDVGLRDLVAWRGWASHRGQLGVPATESRLRQIESEVGPLPDSYRSFLAEVEETGAGPGYGLLSPSGPAQARLARGELSWRDGEKPADDPQGVIALGHAGCGVMWLLVLAGPRRGEVWVDAGSSDGRARRVAGTFEEWYRAWLDALVRDAPTFAQWDARCCATAGIFSQLLQSLEGQGMSPEAASAEVPVLIAKARSLSRAVAPLTSRPVPRSTRATPARRWQEIWA